MSELLVPMSVGELLDKISILKIKQKKIQDPKKLVNVTKELNMLQEIQNRYGFYSLLEENLEVVNSLLWDIEDKIRTFLHESDFSIDFIQSALLVPILNDKRFTLKRKINNKFGSPLEEEKSYS